MDFRQEAEAIRLARVRLGRVSRGNPYPAALRARIVAYVDARRATGAARTRAACAELGIPEISYSRWRRSSSTPTLSVAGGFVPVTVSAPRREEAGFVVHGPSGVRVEGMSIAQLAELIRRLS